MMKTILSLFQTPHDEDIRRITHTLQCKELFWIGTNRYIQRWAGRFPTTKGAKSSPKSLLPGFPTLPIKSETSISQKHL